MGQSPGYLESRGGAAEEIAVLRHELANVLHGLSGMTEMLKSTGLRPEQSAWLDAIEGSADQMRFLLRNGIPRQAGGTPGAGSRFNGLRALEQAVTAHAPAAAAKGLRLMLDFAPNLPAYWTGEARLLRQLVDALLSNALKFTDTGDVVVTARRLQPLGLRLSVRDTGVGISCGDRDRIFGMHERGANASDRPGQGLGLSLCRRISAELGGRIECAAGPGGGSEFTFSLPRCLRRGKGPSRETSAFRGLFCVLDLDGVLRSSVAGFLERLEINHGGRACAQGRAVDDELCVTISEVPRSPGHPWPGICLTPLDQPEGQAAVLLRPPVLEPGLQRALLGLALQWRWQRLSPGGRPG